MIWCGPAVIFRGFQRGYARIVEFIRNVSWLRDRFSIHRERKDWAKRVSDPRNAVSPQAQNVLAIAREDVVVV